MAFGTPDRPESLREARCRQKNNRLGPLLFASVPEQARSTVEYPSRHRPNRWRKCARITALALARRIEPQQQSHDIIARDSRMNLRNHPAVDYSAATEIREVVSHDLHD